MEKLIDIFAAMFIACFGSVFSIIIGSIIFAGIYFITSLFF